jgi:hypothetical protein
MEPVRRRWGLGLGCALLVGSACAASSAEPDVAGPSPPQPPVAATSASQNQSTRIGLKVERRVADPATETFVAVVRETLKDQRGWEAAGFEFGFADDAPYTIVLAEGAEVDRMCRPYDTYGRYSCQNGPVVALNADRWRTATPQWTGDLDTYRRMLVNHEVGHLLSQHHPGTQCPQRGEPAPVMAQQSTELDGCLPNPWPLPWEVDCARRHHEPLAPGYERNPENKCGR